jgi:hypothetical protein
MAALERAEGLPGDEEAMLALQSAANYADREGDAASAWSARDSLMHRSHATDRIREQLAAFAWLLHSKPRQQGVFWGNSLMWTYKWVAVNLADSVDLSREQINALIDAMQERYAAEGLGTAPIQAVRLDLAIAMGDAPRSEALYKAWKQNQDTAGADCPACVRSTEVEYWLACGKLSEALDNAKPLLERQMQCAIVPHTTYARFLLPLAEAGDFAQAGLMHGRGVRLLQGLEGCGSTFATHACYLACAGHWEASFQLLTPRIGTILRAKAANVQMLALLAMELSCAAAVSKKIGATPLALPAVIPERPSDGVWDLVALGRWASTEADTLAARLDARNGNSDKSNTLARWRSLRSADLSLPLR